MGIGNVRAYSIGLVGYRTPNIDRNAKEGLTFTDYYSQAQRESEDETTDGNHPEATAGMK